MASAGIVIDHPVLEVAANNVLAPVGDSSPSEPATTPISTPNTTSASDAADSRNGNLTVKAGPTNPLHVPLPLSPAPGHNPQSQSPLLTRSFTAAPQTPGANANGPPSARSVQDFASLQEGRKGQKPRKYRPDEDLPGDIEECKFSLQLFLESRMLESEQLLRESDPKSERLYIATGYGLIQSVKAFMSFEDKVRLL
jgi:hypothetical protein